MQSDQSAETVSATTATVVDPAAAGTVAGLGNSSDPSTIAHGAPSDNPANTIDSSAPIVAADNEPVKRGPGRPRKDGTQAQRLNATTQAPARPARPVDPVMLIPVDYEKPARMAANLWFNLGELVLGPDWVPDTTEVDPVKTAFRDYFEAEKIPTVPPSWALALTLTAYAVKRINKPTVKTRIFGAYEWLKTKISKR